MTGCLEERALAHLKALLAVDTTNPPGNEEEAARYIVGKARERGLEPVVIEPAPGRGSCVVRLHGSGEREALLVNAHLDVVPAGDTAEWSHPPFGAEEADGFVWGRGALDMKHMAAMMLAVLEETAGARDRLRGDLVFVWNADEERGGALGARYLVERHADLLAAAWGIGEAGGFTTAIGRKCALLIQTAEKGIAWMKIRTRGASGHGSMPSGKSAVVRLTRAVAAIGGRKLPVHLTATTKRFLEGLLGELLPVPIGRGGRSLLADKVIARLVRRAPESDLTRGLWPMLANTVSPTMLKGGESPNVIPSEAEAVLDGRTLPGWTADDLVREIRQLTDEVFEVEMIQAGDPIEFDHENDFYRRMEGCLKKHVPGVPVLPYLNPGFTDGKWFSKLGLKWYGFTPLPMTGGDLVPYARLIHSADERVPVAALRSGTRILHDFVTSWAM